MKRSTQLLSDCLALLAFVAVAGLGLAPCSVSAQDFTAEKTQRITTPRVAGASGASLGASISTDGRFLVFETDSKNLTSATTTNVRHVVLFDRQVNAYELISVSTDGSAANDDSRNAQISKTGRYVVFESDATNLDEGGAATNGVSQIYVRDRFLGRTYLVSRTDGFTGDVGNGASTNPSINGTGQFVAYESDSDNLLDQAVVPAECLDDTNTVQDVYARNGDPQSLSTRRASIAPGFHGVGTLEFNQPSFNPFVTDDGTKIAFSTATTVIDPDENNALDVYLVTFPPDDCQLDVEDAITRVSNNFNRIQAANGASDKPIVSADGRYVTFESSATDIVPLSADTNGVKDIFLHDRVFGKNLRCNVTADGDDTDSNPDQAVGGDSENAYLSSSGRYVVFESTATNLGANNSNRNLYWAALTFADSGEPLSCEVQLVTAGVDDAGPEADAFAPVVSGDGNLVFFHSVAANLADGDSSDSNGVADIFVSNRQDCSAAPGVDTDQDGTPDCLDQCPSNSAKVIDFDSDGDGSPDCADGCPANSNKSSPGQCGCGALDTDTDSDGTADCNDNCDDDPAKVDVGVCGCNISDDDTDRDGTPDCNDLCPGDPAKVTPQLCGCGVEETDDTDADGVADCLDACPTDPNATLPDQCVPTATPTPSGPTPTPTLTPTITPTPTPTATATPDPTSFRPEKPNVRAVGGGRVRFVFDDYSQFGGTVVYEVLLRSEDKPRDKRRDVRFRTQKQTLTRRVPRGTYRVAYKVIIDGRSSPFSKLSRFIEVE